MTTSPTVFHLVFLYILLVLLLVPILFSSYVLTFLVSNLVPLLNPILIVHVLILSVHINRSLPVLLGIRILWGSNGSNGGKFCWLKGPLELSSNRDI